MMAEPFADVDYDRLRSVRFGKLPAQIHPDDAVGSVETEPCRGLPEPAGNEDQRQALLAGG